MASELTLDDDRGVAMRQIPFRNPPWNYTVWISEIGDLRRLYYDVSNHSWIWDGLRQPVVDRTGRVGFYIDRRFVPIDRAIALAWIPRWRPVTRRTSVRHRESNETVAHNLMWTDEDDDDEIETIEDADVDDETWCNIEFQLGLIRCKTQDQVSSLGRFRRSDGTHVLPSTRAFNHIFLGIERVGLIPIDLVSDVMFGRYEPSRPPPRIRRVISALDDPSLTVIDISKMLGTSASTTWSYIYDAIHVMSRKRAEKITHRLVGDSLVKVVRKVADETPVVVRGRLRNVVHLIDRCLASHPDWRTDSTRYARVRILRDLLRREYAIKE